MNAIVADDFTITFTDGSMQTKPQIIESLKRPGGSSNKVLHRERSVEIVRRYRHPHRHCHFRMDAKRREENRPSRYTDTYVKRNGKWQVVASHLSRHK